MAYSLAAQQRGDPSNDDQSSYGGRNIDPNQIRDTFDLMDNEEDEALIGGRTTNQGNINIANQEHSSSSDLNEEVE